MPESRDTVNANQDYLKKRGAGMGLRFRLGEEMGERRQKKSEQSFFSPLFAISV